MCKDTNKCTKFDNDPIHRKEFLHENRGCIYKGMCTWISQEHNSVYFHPPICPVVLQKRECDDLTDEHIATSSHFLGECKADLMCELSNSKDEFKKHIRNMRHRFFPPCINFYKCGKIDDPDHKYSHPCEWGIFCKDTSQDHRTVSFLSLKKSFSH
jgi:hypothetical protein